MKFLGKSSKNVSANEMMWEFFEWHPMKKVDGPAKVRFLFSDKPVQPDPNVPKEGRKQLPAPDFRAGPFSKMLRGKISSVTVTYFDTKILTKRKDTERFLDHLLTTTKGETFSYIPWAQSLPIPTVAATVEHTKGNPGTWLVWDLGQSVYCAYQDEAGRWRFGVWFMEQIPR